MPAFVQYLILAAQFYVMIAYAIARRRRRDGSSPTQRSLADAIVGTTVLAAIVPVAYAALTPSMGERLFLAIWIGLAAFDVLVALFILGAIPITFVAPAILILWAAVNLLFGFRVGNALFILPSILFSALALRSIARTIRRGRETEAT